MDLDPREENNNSCGTNNNSCGTNNNSCGTNNNSCGTNNNSCGSVSAYTNSWFEENNNTGLRDLNTQSIPPHLLPDLPDGDDMDL